MRRRVLAVSLCLCSCLVLAHSRKTAVRANDPAYAPALAAANKFLHAWQTQDHETGIMMLTDAARQHATREQLQEFFSSGSEAAFEIKRGKKMSAEEYIFPAVLFDDAGTPHHAHVCHIVVIKAGKDDWAVDKLP